MKNTSTAYLFQFLILLFIVSPAWGQTTQSTQITGSITGNIREQGTEIPLTGATVLIEGTQTGAAADVTGRFVIENIPTGSYSLRFSMIGYKTIIRTAVVVISDNRTQINVDLPLSVFEGEGVEVVAEYFQTPDVSPISIIGLQQEEIRRSPGAVGDAQRIVQTLPGVNFANDGRNDLIVRGGSPLENLILIDHIEVPNISHFGTQGATGGPVSMLNTDFVDNLTFTTGGFGAQYGNKLSSVMDIELREGQRDGFTGSLDLSFAGAGGALEGPVGKKGSWFIGGRRSFLDLIIGGTGLTAVPKYGNAQAKIIYDLNSRDQISFTALGGAHGIHFERDNESDEITSGNDVQDRGESLVTGLNWRHIWSDKGFSRVTASVVRNNFRTDVSDGVDTLIFRNRSEETDYAIKAESGFRPSSTLNLDLGGGVTITKFNHNIFSTPSTDEFGNDTQGIDVDLDADATRTYAYLQATQQVGSRIKLSAGVRYDNYSQLDNGNTVSPRASVRLEILQNLSLSTAWGIYRQAPALVWFTADENAKKLRSTRTDHYIVGLNWNPTPVWKVSLEVYTKKYQYVPVSTTVTAISTINSGADFGSNLALNLKDSGTAHAEGIELFVQRRLTDLFYTTLAYSLSQSQYTAYDDVERPTSFDSRHVATYVFGTKNIKIDFLRGMFGTSFKVRYATGTPYTPFDIEQSRLVGAGVTDATKINAERNPDYFRTDIRIDTENNFKWGSLISYMELQNALGKQNVAGRLYNDRTGEEEEFLHWGRIFVGGFTLKF